MRFMLSECALAVTPVKINAPAEKQLWPSTETEWHKVLQGIYKRQELPADLAVEARANEKRILNKAVAQGRLVKYCERLLVAYLLSHKSPPPVSYIGLSKLSCKPFFLWLEAVGEVTNCVFYINGSHNKWHPSWSRPALADNTFQSKIDNSFLRKVECGLCEDLKASRLARARAQSASSNSSEGVKATMRLRDKRETETKLMADRQFSFEK